MWVSATRTVLRSPRYMPAFFWGSTWAGIDARHSAGFVGGYLRASVRGELHTVSVWTDPRSMRDFRAGAVHGDLMPKLTRWASEAAYTSWVQEDAHVPDIVEVTARLQEQPTFGVVAHPNPRHLENVIPRAAPGRIIPLQQLARPSSWRARRSRQP